MHLVSRWVGVITRRSGETQDRCDIRTREREAEDGGGIRVSRTRQRVVPRVKAQRAPSIQPEWSFRAPDRQATRRAAGVAVRDCDTPCRTAGIAGTLPVLSRAYVRLLADRAGLLANRAGCARGRMAAASGRGRLTTVSGGGNVVRG